MNGPYVYLQLEAEDKSPISAQEADKWIERELQKNGCHGLPWMEVQYINAPQGMVDQFVPWAGGGLLKGTRTYIFPPELTRFMNG